MTRIMGTITGNSYLDPSLENYLLHGLEPGGFLCSVLCNDLYGAVARADAFNRSRISVIVFSIMEVFPEEAYGSPRLYREWLDDEDGRRSSYKKIIEQRHFLKKIKNSEHEKANDPPF